MTRPADRLGGVDRAALASLEEGLLAARQDGDRRPPFAIVVECLAGLGVEVPNASTASVPLAPARDEWLRRLRSASRSESTLVAYRIAIDDLAAFLDRTGRTAAAVTEEIIVAHLDDYRGRSNPAEATYYRRFTLLRRFFRWLSRRYGVADPFLELEAPGKPQTEADWLSPREFARLLAAAGNPGRRRCGLAERDRLVLLALVVTGLRRSELVALDWGDLELDDERPSLLVRRGKGGKRDASRSHPRSPASSCTCAKPSEPGPMPRFSAVSRGSVYSQRSWRTSSAAALNARAWRSTSPPIRFATRPRPGFARKPATRASLPATSATPTSRPSAATPMSPTTTPTQPPRRSPPASASRPR